MKKKWITKRIYWMPHHHIFIESKTKKNIFKKPKKKFNKLLTKKLI